MFLRVNSAGVSLFMKEAMGFGVMDRGVLSRGHICQWMWTK